MCYFDLNGTKAATQVPGLASKRIRQFHALLVEQVKSGLGNVTHAYAWNDSALLLFHVGQDSDSYAVAMRESDTFKRAVDALCACHAIAVKGQAFPSRNGQNEPGGRVTVIEASSWAMANCFEIERDLAGQRAAWCIDGRIVKKMSCSTPSQTYKVKLLPSNRPRVVHCFKSYLWPIDSARGARGPRR